MKKLKWLLLLIPIWLVFLGYSQYKQESTPPVFNGANEFTTRINTERALYDLEPVRDNQDLINIAAGKCNDMVNRKYFSHTDPEGDYIWSDLPQDKYYGENLAIKYNSSYETVNSWIASPTHKENILDKRFKEVGHYTCFTGQDYITVQLFRG